MTTYKSTKLSSTQLRFQVRLFADGYRYGNEDKMQSAVDCLGLHPYNHAYFLWFLIEYAEQYDHLFEEKIEEKITDAYFLLVDRLSSWFSITI